MKKIVWLVLLGSVLYVPLGTAVFSDSNKNEWVEKRPSCEVVFHYAYSFDEDDYAVLSILLSGPPYRQNAFVEKRAPHGPLPACDSHYSIDDLPFLKKEMPPLLDETYASFLERNDRVAVHNVKSFKNIKGGTIPVVEGKEGSVQCSRVGLSKNKSQVLIYNGQEFMLYQREGEELKKVGSCIMFIT